MTPHSKQIAEMKSVIKDMWELYCSDDNVRFCVDPPGKSVFSAEGFLLWILDKHPKILRKYFMKNTQIVKLVENIMQSGFEAAMGGDPFKSEEENKVMLEKMYEDYVKKYTKKINLLIQTAERRGEERERERTEKLWDLLDSIDSLPDMIHPNDANGHEKCWKMMVKRVEKRHEVLQSDGYSLKPTSEEERV